MAKILACYDNKELINENIIMASKSIKTSKLVVFPTDTVYGIGGNAYCDSAVARLFSLKNRSCTKPIVVLFSSIDKILQECMGGEIFDMLVKQFYPGALTLIVEKRATSKLSPLLNNNSSYIGVRIPNNEIALKLLTNCEMPLATTSANISGQGSSASFKEVSSNFFKVEDLIMLDGQDCNLGIESTVLNIVNPKAIKMVREGAISKQQLVRLGLDVL